VRLTTDDVFAAKADHAAGIGRINGMLFWIDTLVNPG
jgi:hypothetical protein